MAATFTPEDGTGVVGANSFTSLADAETYLDNHGGQSAEWAAGSQSDKEEWLRLGAQYMVARWTGSWDGVRTHETQGLAHPRIGIEDEDGYIFDENTVHPQVIAVNTELARRVAAGDTLYEDIEAEDRQVISESVKAGPISEAKTYSASGKLTTKRYPLIEALIRPLVSSGSQSERS